MPISWIAPLGVTLSSIVQNDQITINFRVWYPLPMLASLFRNDVIKRLLHGYRPISPMGNAMRAFHPISCDYHGNPISMAKPEANEQ